VPHRARTIGMGALLLLLVGCSEPTGAISGSATYMGAPIADGSISFNIPTRGIAQTALLDSDGRFTMTVPMPAGTYQVYYVPRPPAPPGSLKAGSTPRPKSIVPRKYHTLETSDLFFEVKPGTNDIAIEFKD
jgi:hypothetical protein